MMRPAIIIVLAVLITVLWAFDTYEYATAVRLPGKAPKAKPTSSNTK